MSGVAPMRRPWLLVVFIACFILISFAEVWLLMRVGVVIGVPWTLAVLIGEAILGTWLMRREGDKAWRALTDAYSTGKMPSGQLANAALVLAGGLLLIMPGFITDVAGLICLLPWTRPLARRGIGLLIARQISRPAAGAASARSPFADETVIEGETVDPPKAQPEGPVIAGEIED